MRGGRVGSREDEDEWFRFVSAGVRLRHLGNCNLRLETFDSAISYVGSLPNGSFDFVIVDCHEPQLGGRLRCVEAAVEKVRRGGWLVLDDSDRLAYRYLPAVISTWPVRRFVGFRPRPLVAVETSIFRRPN